MPSDLELLTAWKAGDDAAGNELVSRHFESIYMFFDGKVGEGVEDLAQRTFLACLEAQPRIRPDGSFRAYLFGIARNQLLQHYARVHRDARPPDPGVASVESLGPWGSPSRELARHQEARLLARALRRIPLDLQIIVELFYWEELAIADIAEVVQIPGGTVKSRLHRAKELLRTQMQELAASPELIATTLGNLERWARAIRSSREK